MHDGFGQAKVKGEIGSSYSQQSERDIPLLA